jgi:cyclophilin family peptidyl-prolyl cis-trans isomerase
MNIAQVISRMALFHRRRLRGQAPLRIAACAILVAIFSLPRLAAATNVRMETTLGVIDIALYDNLAPLTVANFLRYVGRGDYTMNNGFIHRHATFASTGVAVIQGGGYAYLPNPFNGQPIFLHIPTDPPVQNEYLLPNVRGTIAMAKSAGLPDSATSEWYFNLIDNSTVLDSNNSGGFTVFGEVIAGMDVVDAIAGLPTQPSYLPMSDGTTRLFSELPVYNYDKTIGLQPYNLVTVTKISKFIETETLSGATAVFTAAHDMTFSSATALDSTTTASLLAAFTQPADKTIEFSSGGILTFTVSGAACQTACTVTLDNGDGSPATYYYAYGPTPDNPAPHWYDFSFNSETGAEFVNGKILLHFVDGKRGDDDLDGTNGSITHTGISAAPPQPLSIETKTLSGATAVFTTDNGMTFSSATALTTTASLLATFTQPVNKIILFNSGGLLTFTMDGAKCLDACTVTLVNGDGSPATRYYNYGPTPDNPARHWYDFTYDNVTKTGAEFVNGKILLHFVDGLRGDDDITADGSVTHTGISAVAMNPTTPQSSSQSGGGCTITSMPSQTTRNGDWIVISLFLVFLVLIRRRARMH